MILLIGFILGLVALYFFGGKAVLHQYVLYQAGLRAFKESNVRISIDYDPNSKSDTACAMAVSKVLEKYDIHVLPEPEIDLGDGMTNKTRRAEVRQLVKNQLSE